MCESENFQVSFLSHVHGEEEQTTQFIKLHHRFIAPDDCPCASAEARDNSPGGLWCATCSCPICNLFIFSVVAITIYSYQLQWIAPMCILLTILCGLATWRLWRRTHVHAALYLSSILIILTPQLWRHPISVLACVVVTCLAAFFSVVSLIWAVLDLTVYTAVITPAKVSEPCDGMCGTCVSDPHCYAWSASVATSHPIVAIVQLL